MKQAIPQPVIIPAVLDVSDDVKPQAKTSFGILLNKVVMPAVQSTQEYINFQSAINSLSQRIRGNDETEPLEAVSVLANNISQRMRDIIDVKALIDISIPNDSDVEKFLSSSATMKMDDGIETPPSLQGHGAQRSLIFALIEAIAKQNSIMNDEGTQERAVLILFEEPELYLHPHLMRKLKNSLLTISQSNGWQVVISTHSPFLINVTEEPKSLIILKKNGNLQPPGLKQLEADPFVGNERENMRDRLRALLNFHPSVNEAFFAKRVVLVEGDTEMAVLKHCNWDIFNRTGITLDMFDHTTIVSCGGKWTIPAFAKLMHSFNIPLRIIHDMDKKNRTESELQEAPAIDPFKANAKIRESVPENVNIYTVEDTFEDVISTNCANDKPFKAWNRINSIVENNELDNYPKLIEIINFAYNWNN